jgi:hypothetical protein
MWEKLKNRTLRFVPRRYNTRIFRGTFVSARMRYSDVAVVEVSGAYEGERGPYSQSFYVQVGTPSVGRKGLAPGLDLVQLQGRKGVAPELVATMPYLDSGGDWEKIVDDATEEVLIGPNKK